MQTLDSGAIHHRLLTAIRPHFSAFIYLSVFFYHPDFYFLSCASLCFAASDVFASSYSCCCIFLCELYAERSFCINIGLYPLIGFFDPVPESFHYGWSPRIVPTVILSFDQMHYYLLSYKSIQDSISTSKWRTNFLFLL